MAIIGQEDVARAAVDLLAAYTEGDGPAYLTHLQTLMDKLIPMFPQVTTALAVHPLAKAVADEWREAGVVSPGALMQLWEDCHESYVGRA